MTTLRASPEGHGLPEDRFEATCERNDMSEHRARGRTGTRPTDRAAQPRLVGQPESSRLRWLHALLAIEQRLGELLADCVTRASRRTEMSNRRTLVHYLSPFAAPSWLPRWQARSYLEQDAQRSKLEELGMVSAPRSAPPGHPASRAHDATTGYRMNLLIVGPPGSGKGTQSLRISRAFGIPHISTGELLRDAIRLGTPLGDNACECVAAGQLVPDALVNELVHARLEQTAAREPGFLLDGFPAQPRATRCALRLAPPRKPRRGDRARGAERSRRAAAHGTRTHRRHRGRHSRATPSVRRETSPVLHHLENLGLLISVDANRPVDDITGDILEALTVSTLDRVR